MTAGEIISRVSNDLGFTQSGKISNPTAKLLARLGECVMAVHDSFLADFVEIPVATVAGQGEYDLGAGVDKIRRVQWPGDWINDVPSLSASHSLPSDITGEVLAGRLDGLYYVQPFQLSKWQQHATQYGGIGTYPVMYSYWMNENHHMIFAVAAKEKVTAGLTITVDAYLSKDAIYGWDDVLPLEDHYKRLLQTLLAQAGAQFAQGELSSHSDYQGAEYYRQKENDFRVQEKFARQRLLLDHHPNTNKGEVAKVDTPWFPTPTD